jgi:hypothetical protein
VKLGPDGDQKRLFAHKFDDFGRTFLFAKNASQSDGPPDIHTSVDTIDRLHFTKISLQHFYAVASFFDCCRIKTFCRNLLPTSYDITSYFRLDSRRHGGSADCDATLRLQGLIARGAYNSPFCSSEHCSISLLLVCTMIIDLS